MANDWLEDQDYVDPKTKLRFNHEKLNEKLTAIEKPGLDVNNPKDFRAEMVKIYDKYRANHNGQPPRWDENKRMANVIGQKVIESTESLLPIISFEGNKDEEEYKKHISFVNAMKELGYTENMIRLLVEWYDQMRQGARA